MQFSPASCYLLSLDSEYTPHVLFSDIFNMCSIHNVRDQFSCHAKHQVRFIILCILMFTFLESRREDRMFSTEW
jgi:hypothetical protein